VVQNSHLSRLAAQADVVLPSTTPYETAGTMVDYLGRFKEVKRVIEPYGASKNHRDIYIALSKILKAPLKKPAETDIKKSMKAKSKHSFRPFFRKEGFDLSPKDYKEFIEHVNASVIQSRRLSWLVELKGAKVSAA
jgi:predicted molibdopterin-dependent oxidoreductase YjgC